MSICPFPVSLFLACLYTFNLKHVSAVAYHGHLLCCMEGSVPQPLVQTHTMQAVEHMRVHMDTTNGTAQCKFHQASVACLILV